MEEWFWWKFINSIRIEQLTLRFPENPYKKYREQLMKVAESDQIQHLWNSSYLNPIQLDPLLFFFSTDIKKATYLKNVVSISPGWHLILFNTFFFKYFTGRNI